MLPSRRRERDSGHRLCRLDHERRHLRHSQKKNLQTHLKLLPGGLCNPALAAAKFYKAVCPPNPTPSLQARTPICGESPILLMFLANTLRIPSQFGTSVLGVTWAGPQAAMSHRVTRQEHPFRGSPEKPQWCVILDVPSTRPGQSRGRCSPGN